jgi:hypothetical protein
LLAGLISVRGSFGGRICTGGHNNNPPDWDENLIFVEDNDGPHGTKGKADNKVKQAQNQTWCQVGISAIEFTRPQPYGDHLAYDQAEMEE